MSGESLVKGNPSSHFSPEIGLFYVSVRLYKIRGPPKSETENSFHLAISPELSLSVRAARACRPSSGSGLPSAVPHLEESLSPVLYCGLSGVIIFLP
jgi:hypothetical protein